MRNIEVKILGLMVIISTILYMNWLFTSVNIQHLIYALIFIAANIVTAFATIISVINYSSLKVPKRIVVDEGSEPNIGVIIPTWSEPPEMVMNTIRSVLEQNYPTNKIYIVVTDDSANPEIEDMVKSFAQNNPGIKIIYNIPPEKDSESRFGDAKAGNLNAALAIFAEMPEIKYIETRDADDLVGDPDFLRDAVGQLEHDEKLAYVQTIKEVMASEGDPFGNMEALFYRSMMLSKNSANAVFPCGSGLVWRKDAILDIGGFPIWNLVEDFHSGSEALRRGWRSMFLPVVGAIGQVCPEDIPNLYKQRGTWALDNIRYLFWAKKKGLSLRQRLHFMEHGLIYIASTMIFIYVLTAIIALMFKVYPLDASRTEYMIYLAPYISSMYLFMYSRARRARITLVEVWRMLQTYFGLSYVYLNALVTALIYGPTKKPSYIVTRKTHKHSLYFLDVLPQFTILGLSIFALFIHIITVDNIYEFDIFSMFWAIIYISLFQRIVRNSWFKWNPIRSFAYVFADLLGLRK